MIHLHDTTNIIIFYKITKLLFLYMYNNSCTFCFRQQVVLLTTMQEDRHCR